MRAGAAQPGLFEVTTSRLQAGGLFVDLAEGRSLGDIVLTSTDERTGQLYQSWALENARVVHYRTADPLRVDLAFGFDAIESTTVSFEGGRPDVQQTSRWEMGGATPVISGGGPGPDQSASAGAGDLLHLGAYVLDVLAYHWGATAPFDFSGSAPSSPAQPTLFDVAIPFSEGAGLFADLAAGRSLGDMVLTSTDTQGRMYQSWALENVRVVHYSTGLDAPDTPLTLQLAFGFDAIEGTSISLDERGAEQERRTSRWEVGGATPVISGGGPGPYQSASAGAGDLLHIGEHVLDVSSFQWATAAPFDFGAQASGAARPTVFDVTLPFLQGAGLFAGLAAGRSLGDIILTSRDDQRRLYQSWTLEDAVSCNT